MESSSIDNPRAAVLPMPELRPESEVRKEVYWHATVTGPDGGIADEIMRRGLLPKDALDDQTAGNTLTKKTSHAYVTQKGSGALNYLKEAQGYSETVTGLPLLVSVAVGKKGTDYSHDDDIGRPAEGEEGREDAATNRRAWFAYLQTYEMVDDFVDDPFSPAFTMGVLKKRLASLKGQTMAQAKADIWQILNAGDGSFDVFIEGSRLERLMKKVDPDRWHTFLTYLSQMAPHRHALEKNLSRRGGWQAEEVKRMYVVSPNGDPDWRKWARLMPPSIHDKWQDWDTMTDINGQPLPGKGKLVRIK